MLFTKSASFEWGLERWSLSCHILLPAEGWERGGQRWVGPWRGAALGLLLCGQRCFWLVSITPSPKTQIAEPEHLCPAFRVAFASICNPQTPTQSGIQQHPWNHCSHQHWCQYLVFLQSRGELRGCWMW